MSYTKVRKFLREFLFARPRGKWDAVARVWTTGLVIAWSAILNIVAFLTGNIIALLLIYGFLLALGIVILSFLVRR